MTAEDLGGGPQDSAGPALAAQWPPEDYLREEAWVACVRDELAGFAVARRIQG